LKIHESTGSIRYSHEPVGPDKTDQKADQVDPGSKTNALADHVYPQVGAKLTVGISPQVSEGVEEKQSDEWLQKWCLEQVYDGGLSGLNSIGTCEIRSARAAFHLSDSGILKRKIIVIRAITPT
jgi:hypothetical protein